MVRILWPARAAMARLGMSSAKRVWLAICCGATATACADALGEHGAPAGLPARFYFVATAVGGDTINCRLSYVYEIDAETYRSADRVEYEGSFGGEAARAHLQLDGSGEAFFADVAGPFRATVFADDSLELRYTGPESPERYRFWDEQVVFAGRRTASALGVGKWSCEPLDVRSDTTGIAPGTWRIQANPPT